jgi:hypothetical protein
MNGTYVMTASVGTAVIVVENVLVVRRMDFGWHCEIAGEPVFVSTLQVASGFLMPEDGTRGAIKLRADAVDDMTAMAPRAFRGVR